MCVTSSGIDCLSVLRWCWRQSQNRSLPQEHVSKHLYWIQTCSGREWNTEITQPSPLPSRSRSLFVRLYGPISNLTSPPRPHNLRWHRIVVILFSFIHCIHLFSFAGSVSHRHFLKDIQQRPKIHITSIEIAQRQHQSTQQ